MAEVMRYETPDLQDHDPNYRSGNAVVVLATDYDAALARIAQLEAALAYVPELVPAALFADSDHCLLCGRPAKRAALA